MIDDKWYGILRGAVCNDKKAMIDRRLYVRDQLHVGVYILHVLTSVSAGRHQCVTAFTIFAVAHDERQKAASFNLDDYCRIMKSWITTKAKKNVLPPDQKIQMQQDEMS